MNEAMKALGGKVHYTEYSGVGHNSWDKAFAKPEFLTWLLPEISASAGFSKSRAAARYCFL